MIHLGTDIAARNFCMTAVARCFRTFIKPLIFRPKFMSSRSSSHITYQWQEGVENLEGYSAGGFHPVKIGDEFRQARYRVVHKLGYGGSSTAWLVRDSALNRYVCLKILAANSSDSDAEQRVWKAMHDPRVFDPGRKFVSFSIDQFELQGPNGNHTCLVKEVLGPTLSDVKNFFAHEFIPLHIARKATVQLALGLAYIHSRGIIHGDVHLKNAALRNFDGEYDTLDQVYADLGVPQKNPIYRYDGKLLGPETPPYAVLPATYSESMRLNGDISIFDFGAASLLADPESLRQCHAPLIFRPPEALLAEPVGQPADIWSFACTVFALFNNQALFETFMPDRDEVLMDIVDALGPLPTKWWTKWEFRGDYFHEDGTKKTEDLTECFLEDKPLALRIERIRLPSLAGGEFEPLTSQDYCGLQTLLKSCLRYEPGQRATALDILNMDWIRQLMTSIDAPPLPP